MGEIRLDHCCRLCLKEGFSLTNIFSHRSEAGDPLNRILSFIYNIKIDENDGFPSKICSPCMWRMIEFDACKRNVRSAEAEIMRLLNKTRPEGASDVKEVGIQCVNVHFHVPEPSQQCEEGDIDELESTEMDKESKAGIECSSVNTDVLVKEEIDIVEWEMPVETVIQEPEGVQHFRGVNEDDFHDLESSVEPVEIPAGDFGEKCNEQVFCQPLRESSQLCEITKSTENIAITTTQENNKRIRDANKRKSQKDLRDHVVHAQESLSSEQPKSFLNVTEPGPSNLEAPLSKMKNRLICDICRKSFQHKSGLTDHIRVHYDYRLFSCSVCSKSFKQEKVRHEHELNHLRDKMSFGKSDKRSKKNQYICGICGKNFGSRSGLFGHSIQHNNKYKCNYCGKSFSDNANLRAHIRIHTKEKPFKCEVCFQSFTQKCNLTRHLLIHSSERPFSCEVCDKSFKSKEKKTRHELQHLRKK